MSRRSRLPLLGLLLLAAGPLGAAPQQGEEPEPPPATGPRDLLGLAAPAAGEDAAPPSISAEKIEEIDKGIYLLTGYADIQYGILRLQADRIVYDVDSQVAEAEGNVVLIQGDGTLGAARMVMNMESGEATLWDVTGYTPPYYQFRAARLERVDAERFWIYDAVFTTCTQPVPYWSFKVHKGRVRLEHYAHLRGVAFKTGKLPIIYLPYLLWPVKEDRATGFLMPQIGSSQERGTFLGTAFFWAMRRNMDATIFLDYYSKAGGAAGLEYRYVPNANGQGRVDAYYLPSDVDEETSTRYRYGYRADQRFGEHWGLLADVNVVSDAEFYKDFERDFGRAVNVQELSNLDLTRAWSYYALNLRAERRKQFFTRGGEVVQRRLPEVELRARSQQLGDTPIYLSFEGSANELRRKETTLVDVIDPVSGLVTGQREETTFRSAYERLDAGLTLSASLTPKPWLDVTPTLSLRDTYYTQSAADGATGVSDDSVNRGLASLGLDLLGPKLYRTFEPPPDSGGSRFKNTIEPRLTYRFISDYDETVCVGGSNDGDVCSVDGDCGGGTCERRILLYDEVDSVPTDVNTVTWALTSRLLRKRALPPSRQEPDAPTAYESASEIATVELRQTVDLNRDLTVSAERDAAGDPVRGTRRGPVSLLGRYNPSPSVSADVRFDYDVLFDDLRSFSVSASASSPSLGRAYVSYYAQRDVEGTDEATGTLRLGGGSAFWRKKISFDVDFSYDLKDDMLQSQRYQIGYRTQCCGFQVEYVTREFGGLLGPTREVRFVVSLQGIGTFLDLNSRIN